MEKSIEKWFTNENRLSCEVTNKNFLVAVKCRQECEYANSTIIMSAFKGFSENQIEQGEGCGVGGKHLGKVINH